MKFATIRKFLVLGLTAMLALPAMAQEDALKAFPGYVDFGELTGIFGEPNVQISVGASLLSLVGSLSAKEDPEAAELFKRLKGVRVNVFENTQVSAEGLGFVKDVSAKLSARGWESVVSVNSEDEQVRIFMLIRDDIVEGITVMAVEPTEAVFVNVIGNISPAELEKVMDNFDVQMDGAK